MFQGDNKKIIIFIFQGFLDFQKRGGINKTYLGNSPKLGSSLGLSGPTCN